jgi:hypothetical protein
VGRAVWRNPLQVKLGTGGADDRRDGIDQSADLRVTVALALHRLRVQPHRDVVDEDPAVDLAQVDHVLAPVDERIESPDNIVAVHPQVEGEMVPRTRRDAGEWQTVFGGRGGHDRVPSPPAAATLSAPAATASCMSCFRSSPRCSSTHRIPRWVASSVSPTLAAFPPPDHGLMNNTACRGGSAAGRRTCTRNATREAACQITTPITSHTR